MITRPALATVRLVACGNADRGDDGLAWRAIRPLVESLPPDVVSSVEVRRATELRVEDLLDLAPGQALLIVDAVSGIEPGAVVRYPLDELAGAVSGAGRAGRPTPRSSHQLPIELVVGLAETLLDRRIGGVFIGLGGQAFGFGEPLSEVVSAALPGLRQAILREVRVLAEVEIDGSLGREG